MPGISATFKFSRPVDRQGPKHLTVIDIGAVATKVVVLIRTKQTVQWEKAILWPKLQDDLTFGDGVSIADLITKEHLAPEYVSIVNSSGGVLFRLLNFPGRPGDAATVAGQVRQTLGVDENYSVTYQVIQEILKDAAGQGKDEYAVLASAIPTDLVERYRLWLAEVHLKPVSLRASGVAAANLIQSTQGLLQDGISVGFLDIGASSTLLLIFHGQELALARQFKFGSSALVDNLKSSFELDNDTAIKLFNSGSFDFSSNVGPIVDPWLHQLGISLDFFERKQGKTVRNLYLYGSGSQSRVIENIVGERIRRPVQRWNSVESLAGLTPPLGCTDLTTELFVPAVGEGLRIIRSGETNAV